MVVFVHPYAVDALLNVSSHVFRARFGAVLYAMPRAFLCLSLQARPEPAAAAITLTAPLTAKR